MARRLIFDYIGNKGWHEVWIPDERKPRFYVKGCFHRSEYYEGELKSCLQKPERKLTWLIQKSRELERLIKTKDRKQRESCLLEFAETLISCDCFWRSPPMSWTDEFQPLKDDALLQRQAELSRWQNSILDIANRFYHRWDLKQGRYC